MTQPSRSINLQYLLPNGVPAKLTVTLKLDRTSEAVARALGCNSTEMDNLLGQVIQEITEDVAGVLGIAYSSQPE